MTPSSPERDPGDPAWTRFRALQRSAREQGRLTDELLTLYVLEAFLRRLSISPYRDRLILKGGVLLAAIGDRRPTRDVDLQARQLDHDAEAMLAVVIEIVGLEIGDGLRFSARTPTRRSSGRVRATTEPGYACPRTWPRHG